MTRRKRIAIFMGEIVEDYQHAVLKAIFKKANALQYDTFVFSNYGAWGYSPLYADGEKKVLQIPDFSRFDGIIVGPDTLKIDSMVTELDDLLRNHADCPVVSLRSQSDVFYNVLVEDRKSIASMTRHFTNDHGFRDICFMTGKLEMQDAKERYEGFLEAMDEAGIPVTEHMVFKGNYWKNKAKEALDWFMEGRTTYPQAIICSNDYMALSICEELANRGVRVPEEVCVSGYDDVEESRRNIPSLTSARVPFDSLGEEAVTIIDNLISGKLQPQNKYIQSDLIFRKSCGCAKQANTNQVYQFLVDKLHKQNFNITQTIVMATAYQDAYEESEFLRVAEFYFYDIGCPKAYLCFCPIDDTAPGASNHETFPDEMLLKRVFSQDTNSQYCNIRFNRADLLPDSVMTDDKPQNFLFHPLYFKNVCHGYIALLFGEESWPDSFLSSYLMCLSNALENAAVRRQMSNMAEYQRLYQTDPLTGLYNRRGYEKHLRELYDNMKNTSERLSIVSIDMDGLKYINDHFGHAEGDDALCILASLLLTLINKNEVCARVGGDEFFVLLLSDDAERTKLFRENFLVGLQICAREANKPYPISASIGICCINDEPDKSLLECIRKADTLMYEHKRHNKLNREYIESHPQN